MDLKLLHFTLLMKLQIFIQSFVIGGYANLQLKQTYY